MSKRNFEPRASYGKKKVDRQRTPPHDPRHWGALCDLCPLKDSMPVHGDGPERPALAIVGEAPGQNEVAVGVPFVGKSGEFVEERLKTVGLSAAGHAVSRREVLLENSIACFPPGGDMKAFLQRAKKAFKEVEDAKPAKERAKFMSAIDCCRPRLMFALGVPRCSICLKWDLADGSAALANGLPKGSPAPELPAGITCTCQKPRWVKPPFGRPKAVLAAGNAALESLRGSGGIMDKQLYVFENKERAK